MIYVQTAAGNPVSISQDEAREALRERRRQLRESGEELLPAPSGPRLVYGFQVSADQS